jgi:hypothetical protein
MTSNNKQTEIYRILVMSNNFKNNNKQNIEQLEGEGKDGKE